MADRFGITLCGFVRGDSAKVYTHPHRIVAGSRAVI
jgi:formate dehydrogenase assembly factor FdhD